MKLILQIHVSTALHLEKLRALTPPRQHSLPRLLVQTLFLLLHASQLYIDIVIYSQRTYLVLSSLVLSLSRSLSLSVALCIHVYM